MESFDLVVIGSGPAGEKGAAQAAYFGKRVALIELRAELGGAGVNTGTVPSKTLRESALYFSGLRQRGLYGIDYSLREGLTVQGISGEQRQSNGGHDKGEETPGRRAYRPELGPLGAHGLKEAGSTRRFFDFEHVGRRGNARHADPRYSTELPVSSMKASSSDASVVSS